MTLHQLMQAYENIFRYNFILLIQVGCLFFHKCNHVYQSELSACVLIID